MDSYKYSGPSCGSEPRSVDPWVIVSGGDCIVEDSCVHDGTGDYGANEDCTFQYVGALTTLFREEWVVEEYDCRYDFLQVVGGAKYCGAAGYDKAFPATMPLSSDTTFTWKTDTGGFYAGFKLCAREAPPRACHRHHVTRQSPFRG